MRSCCSNGSLTVRVQLTWVGQSERAVAEAGTAAVRLGKPEHSGSRRQAVTAERRSARGWFDAQHYGGALSHHAELTPSLAIASEEGPRLAAGEQKREGAVNSQVTAGRGSSSILMA